MRSTTIDEVDGARATVCQPKKFGQKHSEAIRAA
jgi:hypothetical protein